MHAPSPAPTIVSALFRRTNGFIGICCLLLSVWVLALHGRIAWQWGGGELVSSDPPAHFTSGVLVYDYLRTGLGTNPLKFAEGFYVRYPKVAIGHWPPVYYGVQAIWYCLFGVSVWAAQWLSAATALGLAALLFKRTQRGGGNLVALLATLIFLSIPLVQRTAWQVMSDLLTGFFVFLALLAFSDWLDTPKRLKAGLWFLLWSILAVLTKGTAWALGPFVVLAPLLTGRSACYRQIWYWGSGLAMAALGSLFFLVLQTKGMGYPVDLAKLLGRFTAGNLSWQEWLHPLKLFLQATPAVVLVLAALGFLDALKARWQTQDQSQGTTDALVAATWLVSQALFFFLLPLTGEARALLPSLAPAALLAARTLRRVFQLQLGTFQTGAGLGMVLAACAVASAGLAPADRIAGYAQVARAIPYPARGNLILISSDSHGEGAFIVERLVNDPNRSGVVLRASQMLTQSDWMGTQSKALFESAEAVREHLKSLGVRYVVIDHSAKDAPLQNLLVQAVADDPRSFIALGRFPVADGQGGQWGEIRLYKNLNAQPAPKTLSIRLGAERGGRVLEYTWPGNPD